MIIIIQINTYIYSKTRTIDYRFKVDCADIINKQIMHYCVPTTQHKDKGPPDAR